MSPENDDQTVSTPDEPTETVNPDDPQVADDPTETTAPPVPNTEPEADPEDAE